MSQKSAKKPATNKAEVSSKYELQLAEVKSKIKVGDFLRRWSNGVFWYQILAYNPLHPGYGRRTMHLIAVEVNDKPSANKRVWSFTDCIQFSLLELHETDLAGAKRVVIVPDNDCSNFQTVESAAPKNKEVNIALLQ